jgi:lincosamide nucleotidyltransferase A/C/D/E
MLREMLADALRVRRPPHNETGSLKRMTMTAADVVEILGWLRAASADVWLDGGWGVDALVGEQTREHKDLDLIVRDSP